MNASDIFEVSEFPRRQSKSEARAARKAEKAAKRHSASPLISKSETQAEYIERLRAGENVFGVGPAGTGKTYIPARIFAQKLLAGSIQKIIIARATVTQKRHALGFRPGKTSQKLGEWMIPVIDAIKDEVGGATVEKWKNDGRLEFVAFETMRGLTLRDAGFILDEGQNCTLEDLKLVLTRVGEDCQIVITGDTEQTDLDSESGLEDVIRIGERGRVPMAVIRFDDEDVVRSAFVKAWVAAFRNAHC